MLKVLKNSEKKRDLLIDALELAVLVIGIIVVVRFVYAMYVDKREHEDARSGYYVQTEAAMQEYSALHTGGNSYASMIYSEDYKAYASIEEAEVMRDSGVLMCGEEKLAMAGK